MLLELDHEGGAVVPVRAHLGREVAAVERGLDDAGREGGAVEAALVLWDGDEPVDERLLRRVHWSSLLAWIRFESIFGIFAQI